MMEQCKEKLSMPSFLRNSCFVMFIPALELESFSRYFLSAKRASYLYFWAMVQ